MGLRKILTDKEPSLHKVCRPVEKFDHRLHKLLDDMVETMRGANGCGLAAVQVGVLRRIVVIETEEGLFEFINPVITRKSGTQEGAEGCLSLPGKWGKTKRPKCVTVEALDRHGNKIEVTGFDLLAKAMCHEIDHLDGILYTDKVIKMLEADEVE